MGPSLPAYLRLKVHPSIKNTHWSRILVNGSHRRDPSSVTISSIEKRDKPFNWQRPTVSCDGSKGELRLHCFPGLDYVYHYAAITATYLSLEGREEDAVRYTLPTQQECLKPLLESNLASMGAVDIVVVGYVQALERWTKGAWEGDHNDLFSWRKSLTRRGHRLAFLGCRSSFWGDIAGNMVRALQSLNGVKCVLYIGKLGSLRADHVPNRLLATGSKSVVRDGEVVEWVNPLAGLLGRRRRWGEGGVLWWMGGIERFDFVDPEIGHMAQASVEGGTEFGYLHIISDNLARKYAFDLSNERLRDVVGDRKRLVGQIEEVLSGFFDEWEPS
ncbi:MAG: hypothetical protein Q9199_008005 [Rusavskia elegans]